MRLYKELRKYMLDAELTVKDLSKQIGISNETIGQRFRGEYPFNTVQIMLIAKVLEIPEERIWDVFRPQGKCFQEVA